jgi:AcrR family transcriptional regulator
VRQDLVLDAAIRVLAAGGSRALTHRAVDAEAGLPLGSTSNLYRTREALLSGVLGQILQHETQAWAALGTDLTPENFAEVVGGFVKTLAGRQKGLTQGLTLARKAIFLEASFSPVLRRQIAEGQRRLVEWAAPLVAGLGSSRPEADLRLILALIDGLLSAQLANPARDFDPAAALTVLNRGLEVEPEEAGPREP